MKKTTTLTCLVLMMLLISSRNSAQTTCLNCTTTDSINIGLLACYPFNGNANDESGNGNNALSNTATLTTDRFGNPNKAYHFNGFNGEYIKCTNTNMPAGNTARTISLWVKFDGVVNANQTLTAFAYGAQSNSNAQGLGLYNGKVRYYSWSNEHEVAYAYDTQSWLHLVGTYDGATASLYANGTLIGSSAKTWSTINTPELYIGTRTDALNSFFNGKIDDVRVYGRALSLPEITQLYTACVDSVTTGLAETLTNFTIGIYPNPSSNGVFKFDVHNDHLQLQNIKISVYNHVGQRLQEGNYSVTQSQLNLSTMNKGIYFVEFMDTNTGFKTIQKIAYW